MRFCRSIYSVENGVSAAEKKPGIQFGDGMVFARKSKAFTTGYTEVHGESRGKLMRIEAKPILHLERGDFDSNRHQHYAARNQQRGNPAAASYLFVQEEARGHGIGYKSERGRSGDN
jgi:hypothetical protein